MTIANNSLPTQTEGNAVTTNNGELVTQFQESLAQCMQLACKVCVSQLPPDVTEKAKELTIAYTYSLHDDNHHFAITLE